MGAILTPWFRPGVRPVRDGVYLTRAIYPWILPSDCWHAMRWHGQTGKWYAADSKGHRQCDLIGADPTNAQCYEWCGLAFDPAKRGAR